MHLESSIRVSAAQTSFAGVKDHNEDSLGICIPDGASLTSKGVVAVIADGVSAAEAGKEAAEICVRNFISDYYSTPDSWSVKKSGHQVIIAVNRWLYGQGQRFEFAHKGYVSTLSIAVFKSNTAYLFHVGDSRIYLLRNNDLQQLTRDHAAVIDQRKRYLSRAVGLDVNLDVDYQCLDVKVGDVFLLTTDGVHEWMADADMKAIIAAAGDDLDGGCNALIAKALENGSDDNLSCQLIRIDAVCDDSADAVMQRLTRLPFPPALRPGMTIDGLRVESEVHASARSQLYRVRDLESGQHYVMKTPSPNFEDDPAYIERFVMESWVARRLNSPLIMKVMERSVAPQFLYHLFESVPGQTLADYGAACPRSDLHKLLGLIRQIGQGLRVMHRADILHQDIKPDNILVDDNGQVRIVDFGSCRVAGIEEIGVRLERQLALGTVDYSAPELHLGQRGTQASDQFALAVVAYELFTGVLPYGGRHSQCKTMTEFNRLHYVSACRYNPMVPEWMDLALEKALRVNPAMRYQEIDEFINDLERPGTGFKPKRNLSWMERNPLRFWQALALVLLITQMMTFIYFTHH